jgi:hypothetical protein
VKQFIKVGLGQVRLWRDEAATAAYEPLRMLECSETATGTAADVSSTAVVIEVCFPTGPRSLYGLLGGRFESGMSRQREIRVGISSLEGPRLLNSLAALPEEPRVGLPEELANEVVTWLHAEAMARNLPGGTLAIDQAAYGLIGSSRSTFAALAFLVVRMLAERFDEQPPELIGEIVRDAIIRSMNGRLGEAADVT